MQPKIWITSGNQELLLSEQPLHFRRAAANTTVPKIQIDDNQSFQTIDGFGFSLTGGSAYLIANLNANDRKKLLKELFSTTRDGVGISYLRLSIGASDLSTTSYSYYDVQPEQMDAELSQFNLHAGDTDVIPVLKQILAINPKIKIMATPWSAPAVMKNNGSTIAGSLKPEYYADYARYFVKYLQAMRDQGITIHAITPQNEPYNNESNPFKNNPSMYWTTDEYTDFVKNHLGPAIKASGFATQIICWDHNCDKMEYALGIFDDPEANQHAAGSAWHLYAGDISALSEIKKRHPDKSIHFTEQWVGIDGNFGGDLGWHAKNVLIGATRNWAQTVLEWNLAADPTCGPHTVGGESRCVGALTIGERIERNVAYYIIAHAAKFIPPGSVRVASDHRDDLPNVAFKTPKGMTALIVFNNTQDIQSFIIEDIAAKNVQAMLELPAGSLATCAWNTRALRRNALRSPTRQQIHVARPEG